MYYKINLIKRVLFPYFKILIFYFKCLLRFFFIILEKLTKNHKKSLKFVIENTQCIKIDYIFWYNLIFLKLLHAQLTVNVISSIKKKWRLKNMEPNLWNSSKCSFAWCALLTISKLFFNIIFFFKFSNYN